MKFSKFILEHRVFLKTLTYRILAICSAIGITFCFGISIAACIVLNILINFSHTVLFYYHEIWWKKLKRYLKRKIKCQLFIIYSIMLPGLLLDRH